MVSGRTALITGSTSGIGLEMAREFAREGANILLNGLGDAGEIEATRAELAKEFSVKVAYDGANMLNPNDIAAMIDRVDSEFGGLDILINNAGIQYVAPIEEFPAEKWDAIIGINQSAAFHTIRAAVPGMKKRGWGRIINTASAHALVASPFKSAYVSAKHAIAGLTKTIALETATFGITVNAIAPGYVWTPLVEKQIPDTARSRGMTEEEVKRDVLLEAQPTKEFVTVEEIAGLALFLCSDQARSITGVTIPVDGGWTAQ